MEENKDMEVKEVKVDDIKTDNTKEALKVKKSTLWMVLSGILGVLFIVSIFTGGFRGGVAGGVVAGDVLTKDEASNKAITYINTYLLSGGQTAKAKNVEESGNLYNIKLDVGGREYDSYVTKDGKLLFPSVVELDAEVEEPATQEEQPPEVVKSDKPEVQLFVMSHCPYGTQSEKGIIPVVEILGDKIDFDIKYVNYAMHGEKEVKEQLNQYCIKSEQGDKFLDYLKCFLKEGDGASCLSEAGIDKTKLESCTKKTDTEFKITENLENPSGNFPAFLINDEECEEYGISGSPTLVINNKVVSSSRSPAAYLATICNAFNEAPEECEEELSTANPSAGFGYEETDNPSTGTC